MYVDLIFIFIFKIFILFICFWLCWISITALGLCLVAASRACSHTGTEAPHSGGFSCCGAWALSTWASAVVTHGLVALQHVGFSRIRDGTCVTCIGRQTLTHCAIREVQTLLS